MQKMMLTRAVKIRGAMRNKGEVVTLTDPVAARMRIHGNAVTHQPEPAPKQLTLADVEQLRADGASFRKVKRLTGVAAAGWKELYAALGG